MKILLINYDKGWGGGQEHLQTLATKFNALGHTSHFFCRSGSPSESRFSSLGFSVHSFSSRGIGRLTAILKAASVIRRERFDIVMVAREHDLLRTVFALKLAHPFQKRCKLVASYHTATSRKQPFLYSADAVVCISRYVRDKVLARNKLDPARITVIHNGIDVLPLLPDKHDPWRRRRYFSDCGFPLVGMVGAFFKNQSELIDVISRVVPKFPNLKLVFVGDDSDPGLLGPLKLKIEELEITDNVIFTGRVPHERLHDIFSDFDLSVSTFRNEGFGLVHLESLSAGTPVIAYNEGGQVDILAGEEVGILVDDGVSGFAAAIIELLNDHERRLGMGRRGYDLVRQKFSVDVMAANYLKLYNFLLNA